MALSDREKHSLLMVFVMLALNADVFASVVVDQFASLGVFLLFFVVAVTLLVMTDYGPTYIPLTRAVLMVGVFLLSFVGAALAPSVLSTAPEAVAQSIGVVLSTAFVPIVYRLFLPTEYWTGGGIVKQKELLRESKQFQNEGK